jgi:hypothetical protein
MVPWWLLILTYIFGVLTLPLFCWLLADYFHVKDGR